MFREAGRRGGEGEGQEDHGEGSRQEEAGGVCLPSLPPSVSQITHPPSVQLPSASLVRRQKGGRHRPVVWRRGRERS